MKKKDGFTLIELLVVIVIIAILAAIQIPALARGKQQTQAASCMSNSRQLIVAWSAYTRDFNDNIAYSLSGSGAQGGAGYNLPGVGLVHSWASGWIDWTTGNDNTNTAFLTAGKYALLAPYLSGKKNVFKCPVDDYLSTVQRAAGWSGGRCRSVSGDVLLGNGNAATGPLGVIYRQCIKVSDLQIPSPSETWAFMDEHPDSINDPASFPPDSRTHILDTPATYHNNACSFSFCDGHTEMHKWQGCMVGGRAATVIYQDLATGISATTTNDPDVYFLSYHSPRKAGAAGTPF